MDKHYTDFRYEHELYSMVTSIDRKRYEMNVFFQEERYGEAVNYARSLIEATCKYVYHEITGKEIEEEKGHNGYISLNNLAKNTLSELSSLITHKRLLDKITKNLLDIINTIGEIRNHGAASHGSRTRNIEPGMEETLLVIGLADDICNFLLKLLYSRTTVEEKNVIGGKFDSTNLANVKSFNNPEHYRVENSMAKMSYDFWVTSNLITSIEISLSKEIYNLDLDTETISTIVRDCLPPDIGKAKKFADKHYQYYSNRHDRLYEVIYSESNDTIFINISGIETDEDYIL